MPHTQGMKAAPPEGEQSNFERSDPLGAKLWSESLCPSHITSILQYNRGYDTDGATGKKKREYNWIE